MLHGPPTLLNIALDLQITICTLLHPVDILALRETCKTLQLPTRRRVVWVAALHRVCIDNSLFLPSFPILDMSDVELERAAMAPRRWIELCASFDRSCAKSRPITRIIEGSSPTPRHGGLFIVPGGRYVVNYSYDGIFVWDLGYTSSVNCKLIASVAPEGASCDCMVQTTPDGMGLIILCSRFNRKHFVYEIYPQSEAPQLTQIANLDFRLPASGAAYLLPDRVLWRELDEDLVVFRIWDYRVNHSTSFSAEVWPVDKYGFYMQVMATQTAIIILCEEGILVWAMPPLSPQLLDFFDNNPTCMQLLLAIELPDGILDHTYVVRWQTMSHWYCGSPQPLYFDLFCEDLKLHKFKIIVESDPFDTSLHIINTEFVPNNYHNITFHPYTICEDAVVACWESEDDRRQIGAYTGLTSSRSTTAISYGDYADILFPTGSHAFCLCPASGRYVHFDKHNRIVVVDFI